MRATLVTLICLVSFSALVKSDCEVDNTNSIFPTPLFIEANLKRSFYNPTVRSSKLVFNVNEKIVIACTGAGNSIDRLKIQEAEVKCESSGKFSFKGIQYELDQLKCQNWPESVQHINGACGGSFKLVDTAFHVAGNFIPVMSTCFDDKTDRTLYTKMTLSKNAGFQKRVTRPVGFNAGTFFR